MKNILAALIALAIPVQVYGQGSQLPKYTVSTLPSASVNRTLEVQVIDAISTIDCVIGGGTGTNAHNVNCIPYYNGSAWVWRAANQSTAAAFSLTTAGTTGASTFSGTVLNIPQYQGALTITTTGSSGPSTLSGNTLNIPQYSGSGGSVGTTGQLQMVGSTAGSFAAAHVTDDGTTTTVSNKFAVNGTSDPSQQTLTYNGGHSPTGLAGSAVIAPDTSGNFDVNENNGGFSRVCTAGNGQCATTAGAVQYNPTTTALIFASFSGLYDDADSNNSRTIGVPSSVTCVHTTTSTCTVAMTAHGLAVAGAVDMTSLASWPVSPAGSVQQAAQYGSFQITTVPDANHFTFTTPTTLTYTCSPCTGNIYDASYWAIWLFAKEPFVYGHGTVYGIEASTQSLAGNFSTLTSGISGTPKILIDQTGVNDLAAGRTVSQIETDHQSVYTAAHTAGMLVWQTTLVPAIYGVTGHDVTQGQLNLWFWSQYTSLPANLSNGKYIDMYSDPASAIPVNDYMTALPTPQPTQLFADTLNATLATQKTLAVAPPVNFTYSATSLGGNGIPAQYVGKRRLFYDDNYTQTMDWKTNRIDIDSPFYLPNQASSSGQNCVQIDTAGLITKTGSVCAAGSTGLSGMTAGQVAIAATATTVTSSKAILGTDTSLVSGTGTFTASTIAIGTSNGGVTNATALPNGITATTQSAADNSTKVATTAYVDAHFIASGTSAMGTSAISSGACATVVTTSATGTATTDVIVYTPNADPTGITGYAVSATGSLYIWAYPTTNNVNFKVCNNTSGSLTPGALTLNWTVRR